MVGSGPRVAQQSHGTQAAGRMDLAAPRHQIPALAVQRERSMLIGCLSDLAMLIAIFGVSIWANSLMMSAESLRGVLLISLEAVLFLLLRRIHRGQTASYDYGAGKLEQFANLSIGTAMGLGGIWVAVSAAYRWSHTPEQADLGLDFAALAGLVNVVQNALALWALWRAGRDGGSVIIVGQIRTRFTKLLCSILVLAALCVNAAFGGERAGVVADVLGSAFVSLVMFHLAVSMWREALPSLLDRSLAETQQEHINRALVQHFALYDDLVAVRSRLSGNTPVIEVVLGFAADRRIGEIQQVVDEITRTVQGLIPESRITVTPVAQSVPAVSAAPAEA
jgi:divalent metal cation (Fe/Co/Zn/Cd) transporter